MGISKSIAETTMDLGLLSPCSLRCVVLVDHDRLGPRRARGGASQGRSLHAASKVAEGP